MAISLKDIGGLIRPALLEMATETPQERDERRRIIKERDDKAGAEEHAKYTALSLEEKVKYDELTRGMMPRVAGVQELTEAEFEWRHLHPGYGRNPNPPL